MAQNGNSPAEYPSELCGNLLLTNGCVSQRPGQMNVEFTMCLALALPWDDVSSLHFSQWLENFSKAQGPTKELMFMSILPTVLPPRP